MTQTTSTAKPWLRVADVAERMGLSQTAVRKWILYGLKGRKLRATRAGMTGMWRIDPEDLADFLSTND